jgi:hypothetical protein
MMPEPAAESHGYNTLLDSWAVCHFLGGKGIVGAECSPDTN